MKESIIAILQESFDLGHNNESYQNCELFAEFLMSKGLELKKEENNESTIPQGSYPKD